MPTAKDMMQNNLAVFECFIAFTLFPDASSVLVSPEKIKATVPKETLPKIAEIIENTK